MQQSRNHKNLKSLWWMRNIALAGQALAILIVTRALAIPLPETPLWMIFGALAVVNIYTWRRIRNGAQVSDQMFLAQLLIDVVALFGLLYFSGGATNPFASLFILQVIIAAVALPAFYTWLVAAITISAYTALMFWNVEVPYFLHHHLGDFFSLHVQGMWISFMLLAVIVAWFVVRMNGTIRRQDALLAEAEKIAALGVLATGAAHELGTPLATMAVLAEDCPPEKARQLAGQITRCKQILSRITAAGGVTRAEGGAPMALDDFLGQMVEEWQLMHPAVKLETKIGRMGAPRIVAEQGLKQTLVNLLDNAADASPHWVRIEAQWSAQELTVRIQDKGAGIAAEIKDTFGQLGVTTKADGFGLGLFLAKSVIARLEGSIEWQAWEGQGTVVVVTLPLRKLAL